MDRNRTPPCGILHTLGEEIVRIVAPVSACMFLVVILVSILASDDSFSSSSQSITSMATIAYDESSSSSDSFWDKLEGALLNSLVFVAVVTLVTFFLVFLFYIRCTKFLRFYMGFSAFVVLGFMGGQMGLLLTDNFSFPIDCASFLVGLLNFAVVGVLAVFLPKMPILVTQSYLVVIAILVAYWFTRLPEWTTWALLIALALYDLAAVLLPVGPLRLLVELAISRDEDIPALVYEARPVVDEAGMRDGVSHRRWRRESENANQTLRVISEDNLNSSSQSNTMTGQLLADGNSLSGRTLAGAEEGRVLNRGAEELSAPLLEQRMEPPVVLDESVAHEGIGLASTGAIKLGLGDFIFYSVLVGRAAMYDFMTVYACYLAIIAGLGVTLLLLAVYQKALPALPVSITLGVVFYFLTRVLLEVFIVQCSVNLVMF